MKPTCLYCVYLCPTLKWIPTQQRASTKLNNITKQNKNPAHGNPLPIFQTGTDYSVGIQAYIT